MMKKIILIVVLLFPFCFQNQTAAELPAFNIALVFSEQDEPQMAELVEKEISTLTGSRLRVDFQRVRVNSENIESANGMIAALLQDPSIDCLIGLGLDTTELLANLAGYPKPVIAAMVLDRKLQGLPITETGSSGIDNFNYIQSPFDVEKDLKVFKKLYDFKHLAVLYDASETLMFANIYSLLGQAVEHVAPGTRLSVVEIYEHDIDNSLAALPESVDAVYLPPVFMGDRKDKQRILINQIIARKLPSFALLGEEDVQLGAMASIAPELNIEAMSRRVALNVLNIALGENAGDLPVTVANYADNFVINAATLEKIDYYPPWNILNEARLIQFDRGLSGRKIQLRGVINEALQANLGLMIERLNTRIQKETRGVAKADLYPQLTLSSSIDTVDSNRLTPGGTSAARHTWAASGSLSQVIFADDILANFTIQDILLKAQVNQEKAAVLDTIIAAAETYTNLLFAQSNRTIQNNNLSVTRKNLDIARNKQVVGIVGVSEVHRWESELATNQISLNDAYRDLQLARLTLNRLLNRDVGEKFIAEEIEPDSSIELLITDPRIYEYLGSAKQLRYFADFLMVEAEANSPELAQVLENQKAQSREVLNRQRAYYLPDISIQGQVDKIIGEYDTSVETPSDQDHPWTIAGLVSWPLYSGNSRSFDLARSRLRLRQTSLAAMDLKQQIQLQVRASLETAAVSAREVELSREALEAAQQNFAIIQAGYAEGRNSIADLIDAQNVKRNGELGAAIAKYQFVLDFLKLEREIGRFHFLDNSVGQEAFVFRLGEFMDRKR